MEITIKVPLRVEEMILGAANATAEELDLTIAEEYKEELVQHVIQAMVDFKQPINNTGVSPNFKRL